MDDDNAVGESFTLKIKLGNDAMQTRQDIAWVLREVAGRIQYAHMDGMIRDFNGNTIGQWEIK